MWCTKAWRPALTFPPGIDGNPVEFELIQSPVSSMQARFEPFFYGMRSM